MKLHFPWYMYAMIYVGIMLICFAVNGLLTAKLKKITPAEVLKNRDKMLCLTNMGGRLYYKFRRYRISDDINLNA
ncbi:MAG: hypothetical protein ACI4SF_10240 [Oscillospiraceae bacterium]